MNKTVLKKIIKNAICTDLISADNYTGNFSPSSDYTEIFSNIKYKDYYLRGQTIRFSDLLFARENHRLIAVGFYDFFFFVLVNNKYQRFVKKQNYEVNEHFGIFVGNTIDEVLEKNSNNNICNYEDFSKNAKLMILNRYILNRPEIIPISIKKEDLEIKENSYLKKPIEEKKDIILLDMDIIFSSILDMKLIWDSIENYSKRKNIKLTYPQKIYSFPAFNYSDIWEDEINDRKDDNKFLYSHYYLDFIKNLYDIIDRKLDYQYLSRKDYLIILRNIGNLAWDWIDKKKITKKYLKYLNVVQSKIGDRNYPFTNFCYKFLDELIADLVTQKQISRCQFCSDFFKYKGNKKYCSVLSKYEDKNCHRQALEQRRYKKKKLKNLLE